MIQKIQTGLLILVLLLVGGLYLSGGKIGAASGTYHTNLEEFAAGISIPGSTGISINSGDYITESDCTSNASFNPPNVGTSTATGNVTTTDATLTGAAIGDVCQATFDKNATTTLMLLCAVNKTATATVTLWNTSADLALDYTTGTLKVCYTAQ